MSIGVSGMICLDTSLITVAEEVSFDVMEILNNHKIAGKMGGNVSEKVYSNYYEQCKKGMIIFEMMDTPLDNTAQELFGFDTYGGEERLESRMSKVQNVIARIFENKHVDSIVLDINYLEGFTEKEISLKYSDFQKKMLSLYKKNSIEVPIVRLNLSR